MNPALAALLLGLTLQGPVEAAGSVFKWVDADGTTHFDDQSRLAERLTRSSIARRPIAAAASATVPADLIEAVRRRCEDLRARSHSMRGARELFGRDPGGNIYRLSERQVRLEQAAAEREQQRYCQPEAARRFHQELLAETVSRPD